MAKCSQSFFHTPATLFQAALKLMNIMEITPEYRL